MKVKEILQVKGTHVWSVQSHQSIRDALKVLVENKIGAVLVLDKTGSIFGILSERDIMRECHMRPKEWENASVSKVMTPVVITAGLEAEVEYVMQLMSDNRIRHVPITENDELVGIVSIGDVVKTRLSEIEEENQHMKDYLQSP